MKKFLKNFYRFILKKLHVVNSSDFNYIINNEIKSIISNINSDLHSKNIEIENLQSELKSSNDRITTLQSDLKFLENEHYKVEKHLFGYFKALEYKVYEFNKSLNEILYKNQFIKETENHMGKLNFTPKVSIVIPAYNASNYLAEAIDSALNQTYQNIEIIVVNDGSNDNGATKKIAQSYGNRIKYFEKENGGVSSALNLGIKNMTGKYFSWLSHDDKYYPNNIEEHIHFLSYFKNNKIITFTNFNIIDSNSNVLLNETVIANIFCFDYKINQIKPEYSLLQGEINGGSILIPKQAFKKCGLFDENLKIAQERDMWARLMKKYVFYNIPIETTSIRFHPGQVTRTNPLVAEETNQKTLEIITNIDKNIKDKLEHSEYNFYLSLKNFYLMTNKEYLLNKVEEILNNLKQTTF